MLLCNAWRAFVNQQIAHRYVGVAQVGTEQRLTKVFHKLIPRRMATEKFAALPMSQSKKTMRLLFANAAKCEPDSQGRIVVPQKLRKYAGLEKETVIIGVNDRAEIWAADTWRAQEEDEMTPEKMAACMAELGF